MVQKMKKPFYFQPPLNVLFEIHRLEKVLPWDVNISYLLNMFLDEMEEFGEVDFRASGMALDSSSTIYLKKTKLLLKLEEPPPPPKNMPEFYSTSTVLTLTVRIILNNYRQSAQRVR